MGSLGSMFDDPHDEDDDEPRPPPPPTFTDAEIMELLAGAESNVGINDWERGFCASVYRQIRQGRTLSQKQWGIVDRVLPKLADGCEDLWPPEDEDLFWRRIREQKQPDPELRDVPFITEEMGLD